jgi:hypothetical protein
MKIEGRPFCSLGTGSSHIDIVIKSKIVYKDSYKKLKKQNPHEESQEVDKIINENKKKKRT